MGDHDRELADLNEGLTLSPRNPDILARRGEAYLELRQYSTSAADLTVALSQQPKNVAALKNRAIAYINLKNPAGALDDLNAAIALQSGDASLFYNRGTAHRDLKDYPNAIADFTQAINLFGNYADAYDGRGWVRILQKDYASAKVDYDRLAQLIPGNSRFHVLRCFTRMKLGTDLDTARSACERAIALSPDNASALVNLGAIALQQSRWQDALDTFTRGLSLSSSDPLVYKYGRGIALRHLGRQQEADAEIAAASADKRAVAFFADIGLAQQQTP